MEAPKKITVLGSINMDLVTTTNYLPEVGETIVGQHFQMNPGGKGANQAVAAARLGAAVQFIGCVGNDHFGLELVQHLKREGVDVSQLETVPSTTGTATIVVSESDNQIIIVPGANQFVDAAFVESKRAIIANSQILILQLEIPNEGVQKAVEIAKENDVTIILNPAPICELPDDLLSQVDYLTPNEHEYTMLMKGNRQNLIEKVILTKGSEGISFYDQGKEVHLPAHNVMVVDTTGAGDSFNGGFAFALSKGYLLHEACAFGNAVGALATTKLGAQTGMPTFKEVEELLQKA